MSRDLLACKGKKKLRFVPSSHIKGTSSTSRSRFVSMVMVQSKKGRRLENLRGKQPIGIAASSASSALLSLPATMGTERLVVDLGSPLCHSMSSLPPLPPSRHTPSSKPAAPRTTPAMPPPASRIHVRPSKTRNGLIDGGTWVLSSEDVLEPVEELKTECAKAGVKDEKFTACGLGDMTVV
ncbi:hypothetical protein M422DRAFT_257676 [Sphaerobolus stellatus SS14]|uniref:Uncharacterized protein n=1 Tax=Sphaerobolus stellatus (strain SS14) TaxID=990650 RepID=A0A0C9VP57_SPHS4|nr:hypothetical protein M422DRAFT_257676 [Sphaerobolus stellatus SS14]